MVQDLIYGIRALAKRPAFTVIALLTLAVGIGANTAIFSVVHAVVLRPLPYDEPHELMVIGRDRDGVLNSVSAPEFVALREHSRHFEAVGTWEQVDLNLAGDAEPYRISGARITSNMLDLLVVAPARGRGFTEEEDTENTSAVVLLSNGFWKRHFGSEPSAVGATLRLDGRDHRVVGVLPASFAFPEPEVELYVPMGLTAHEMENPGRHFLLALGRLADGVSPEQAALETTAILERASDDFSDELHADSHGAIIRSLHSAEIESHSASLLLLLGAVGFLLLIACVNVANLLLARTAERRRELALRAAMGANRGRLVRQLLTESLVLATAGGVLGFVLALWSHDLLLSLAPSDVPRLETITLDWSIFGFMLAVSGVTGVLSGILPALRASRTDLERALNEATRGAASGAGRDRSRGTLVAFEVGLALVLLVAAGLMIRSFHELGRVDPGFDSRNLLTMHLRLSGSRYLDGDQQAAFVARMMEELRAAPGIESASLIAPLPLSGHTRRLSIEFLDRPAPDTDSPLAARWRTVTPGYFKTMRIRLVRGRDFTEADIARHDDGDVGRSVMIVNESFVTRYYPDKEPLGEIVRVGYDDMLCEIVGIVGDVRHQSLGEEAGEEMYTPFASTPWPDFDLAVRTFAEPMSSIGVVQAAVWRIDPEQPIGDVRPMPELVDAAMASPRFTMFLMGTFAGIALLLAASGIYGVISYTVVQRTHEIGIRVALGARSREVLRLVLMQTLALVAVGAGVGVLAALGLSRFLSSELYGVQSSDPTTYAFVVIVLLAVALLAIAVPARRASRVDPLVALRQE